MNSCRYGGLRADLFGPTPTLPPSTQDVAVRCWSVSQSANYRQLPQRLSKVPGGAMGWLDSSPESPAAVVRVL